MTATVERFQGATVVTSDDVPQPRIRPARRLTPWTDAELQERAAQIAASLPPFTATEAAAAGQLAAVIDAELAEAVLGKQD